jgi:hypothetical protein
MHFTMYKMFNEAVRERLAVRRILGMLGTNARLGVFLPERITNLRGALKRMLMKRKSDKKSNWYTDFVTASHTLYNIL